MEDGVAPVSTIEKPLPESEVAGAVALRASTEGNQPPATYSRHLPFLRAHHLSFAHTKYLLPSLGHPYLVPSESCPFHQPLLLSCIYLSIPSALHPITVLLVMSSGSQNSRHPCDNQYLFLIRSWEFREVAVEIGKVLFSHESRILTPGGGAVSPGGTQPPASPPTGHYSQHSPPLIKVFIILVLFHSFQTKSNLSNLCQVRNVIVLLRLSGHVFLALAFVQKLAKDPKDYKL
ncbi:hypothetical protein KQX54_017695 [Cotesia glomerata]|uniref:Uncharacterized protein n=1 Tax=Cotesia glomerata TaxID=32391 RepID=A0AAV7IAE4_COTGL|nr:hypothetical protein KQX54_017695 [Cotesia glomerata]